MSNQDDLRARLDAMVRYDHIEPRGYGLGCPGMARAKEGEWVEADYALDLLKRLDAAEAPCVWSEEETTSHPKPYKTACHQRYIWPSKFCPGCGHPVQVEQKEDSHETYTWECRDCKEQWLESSTGPEEPVCPVCGSKKTEPADNGGE